MKLPISFTAKAAKMIRNKKISVICKVGRSIKIPINAKKEESKTYEPVH